MHEHALATARHGVTDISLTTNPDSEHSSDPDNTNTQQHDPATHTAPQHALNASLTVTFAVTTDTEAWVTAHGDGSISVAFGGTGHSELDVLPYVTFTTLLADLIFKHNVSWNYDTCFSRDSPYTTQQ